MADLNPPAASPILPASPLPLPLPFPSTSPIPTTSLTSSFLPPSIDPLPTNPSNPINSTTAATTLQEPPSLAPKRQRRPSVRLGDIGGETNLDNSNFRRPKNSWRYHKDPSVAIKNSKTRPLTNLLVDNNNHSFLDRFDFTDHHGQSHSQSQTTKNFKSTKPIKRPRTNWTSERQQEQSPLSPERQQEQSLLSPMSPVNSRESLDVATGLEFRERRQISGGRISESSRGHHETNGIGNENEVEFRSNSVKDWLIGLGLGRYAPVFEIHEVDEEVLGMLTMEDLKDMGVNAVGSRRKMYTAIEKLRKEFS